MSDKGFAFQERDSSSPKLDTSWILFSLNTALTVAGQVVRRVRSVESFQERDSSSPKLNTALFISSEAADAYIDGNQGLTDIYGNAISNQHKRGAV